MTRIDKELVQRGFFESRNKALYAIENKIVYCNDKIVLKPSQNIEDKDFIEIRGQKLKYVSKGGLKLEKALVKFKMDFKNKVILDIGSSTGGFCDCALQNGAKKIYAIDVGYNQLDLSLRKNSKIYLHEKTDFRYIDKKQFLDTQIITIDVSFISVNKLIDKISEFDDIECIICLIKPQFECGKENSDKYKGKPLNKEIHFEVINNVKKSFENINFYLAGLTYSPIKGGDGNIEYLSYFIKKSNLQDVDIKKEVDLAFKELNNNSKK